jgi:hypothetical protein
MTIQYIPALSRKCISGYIFWPSSARHYISENHNFKTVFFRSFQRSVAGHASPETTMLYDHSDDDVSLDEIERIVL